MTLAEIKKATLDAKDSIWAAASAYGRDPKIYMHWTAGTYNTTFRDYHINITGDGEVIQTRDLTDVVSATYRRNSGSISLTLCCAYNAVPDNLGDYPPTDIQIEALAQIVAVIADALGVPVDIQHVLTHSEAADNLDGYEASAPYGPDNGCERWDLALLHKGDTWKSGGDILRGKAIYYQEG